MVDYKPSGVREELQLATQQVFTLANYKPSGVREGATTRGTALNVPDLL